MSETRFGPARIERFERTSAGIAAGYRAPAVRSGWWIAAAVAVAALIGLAAGFVRGQAQAQNYYLLALDRAEAEFHATRKTCERARGNEWKACIGKALSDKWRALAAADVRLRNTPEAYRIQRVVDAGTVFLSEIQQCSQTSEARRTVCDSLALDGFRQAMERASGNESAETACTLAGCPMLDVPAVRSARKPSRV